MQIFFLICIPSRLMKNRKIFSLAFPYTNDIGTIQEERRIGEQLAKNKRLIIVIKVEKFATSIVSSY